MIALQNPDTIELTLASQAGDYDSVKGLSGIDESKMKMLKVDLLTSSESIKSLLLRLEQCKINLDSCIQGQSRNILLKKVQDAHTQLSNFNSNISYYNNALGKAITMYQNMDVELGDTITNDSDIIVNEMEGDNYADNK